MSSREKGMARLLSRPNRSKRFAKVIEMISPEASTILDLCCGVGALTTDLAERFPSSFIIGIDTSKYLLGKSHRKGIASTVLADISKLPFKIDVFDVAIAIQILHEIVSLNGTCTLTQTLRGVHASLKNGGGLVIFDHVSPGDAPIPVKLSDERQQKFEEFKVKFKHRNITCQHLGKGLVRISLRDFYDFLTTI